MDDIPDPFRDAILEAAKEHGIDAVLIIYPTDDNATRAGMRMEEWVKEDPRGAFGAWIEKIGQVLYGNA